MSFEDSGAVAADDADETWPELSLGEQAALEMAPKQSAWRDIAGKVWNAPNTALGLAYGGLGATVGEVHHLLNPSVPQPKVVWRDDANWNEIGPKSNPPTPWPGS